MSEENEGLLAYFQRMQTKLLMACSAESGFSDVTDDYLASMVLDAIERIFMQGRRQEGESVTMWEVLKMGVEQWVNVDILMAMETRTLDRAVGMNNKEKSMRWMKYAVMNKMLASFGVEMVRNERLLGFFYNPSSILSSSEHSAMFLLQLQSMECLNFSKVWKEEGGQGEEEKRGINFGPQKTSTLSLLSSSSSSLPLPTSSPSLSLPLSDPLRRPIPSSIDKLEKIEKLPLSSSRLESSPSPVSSHPSLPLPSSNSNPFFAATSGNGPPLIFSLKPKSSPPLSSSLLPPSHSSSSPLDSLHSILFPDGNNVVDGESVQTSSSSLSPLAPSSISTSTTSSSSTTSSTTQTLIHSNPSSENQTSISTGSPSPLSSPSLPISSNHLPNNISSPFNNGGDQVGSSKEEKGEGKSQVLSSPPPSSSSSSPAPSSLSFSSATSPTASIESSPLVTAPNEHLALQAPLDLSSSSSSLSSSSNLSTPSAPPGSAKKRAKKRTIDL